MRLVPAVGYAGHDSMSVLIGRERSALDSHFRSARYRTPVWAKAMHYRVYYFFERSGESVSSTNPVEMSARSIHEQLLDRLRSSDDYLGILDARDNVLQILPTSGDDRFWVELPLVEARASYGRYMALEELRELIVDLPQILDQDGIPDMRYRPW